MKHRFYLFGHTIEEWMPVLYFFIYSAAVTCAFGSVEEHNLIGRISCVFLLISFLLYNYFNSEDKRHKDYEIGELKAEIKKLERISKEDNEYIELLKAELEKARNNS